MAAAINASSRPSGITEEAPVAFLEPRASPDETRFVKALYTTLENKVSASSIVVPEHIQPPGHLDARVVGEGGITIPAHPQGLMLEHLYWMAKSPREAWGNPVPPALPPWDTLVHASNFSAWNSEPSALFYALRLGLLDELPREVCYFAYGPGEERAVEAKDVLLIRTAVTEGLKIAGAATFDNVQRYASRAATRINEEFNVHTLAFRVNLIANGARAIKRARKDLQTKAPSLVAIFGGFFQNVPDEEAVKQYRNIIEHHGKDVHLVMPVNASADPKENLDSYRWSQELEGFILNFFPRAIEDGVIRNQNYNVFAHWQLFNPVYDTKKNAVEIFARAKVDHELTTDFNSIGKGTPTFQISKGDLLSVTFSRKGPIDAHFELLQKAGFTSVDSYVQPGTNLHVIHASCKPSPHEPS
ncbi:MAG: hypothetical protein EOM26_00410 [Alphaproteobacteria bacterium]|nr:hypothetical protein [Alphaproteobacteria bacterium]